ncbi:unnamed protein product [Miscanthus lutarioriparius]|uniref:GIR1-like zinc ribbon domain-containing protein n=1 Tax=Miscanthus lutarioriparius TaxID=422564 RepID=A0A811QZI8_9POAL|nr:unnamed protein product [Miscanthus lutarioriparius]
MADEESSPSSCLSSENEHGLQWSNSPEATSMVLAACPRCFIYVMLPQDDPRCPQCKSPVLLDFLQDNNNNSENTLFAHHSHLQKRNRGNWLTYLRTSISESPPPRIRRSFGLRTATRRRSRALPAALRVAFRKRRSQPGNRWLDMGSFGVRPSNVSLAQLGQRSGGGRLRCTVKLVWKAAKIEKESHNCKETKRLWNLEEDKLC